MKLELFLALGKALLLFSQMLCTLAERVSSQLSIGVREFAVNFLKVVTVVLDLTDKAHVLVLEFFVLVSLVWIELVKSFLVDLVDLTNLVL